MSRLPVYNLLTVSSLICSILLPTISSASAGYYKGSPMSYKTPPSETSQKNTLNSQMLEYFEPDLVRYVLALLKVPVSDVFADGYLSPLKIKDLSETGTLKQEKDFLVFLSYVNANNLLRPTLISTIDKIKNFSWLTAEQKKKLAEALNKPESNIDTILQTVEQTLALRGLSRGSQATYIEWPALAESIEKRLDQSLPGLEHLIDFTKTSFSSAQEIKLLVNGPESFAMRDQLLAQATKSIHILSWAIYSDLTGYQAVETLIQKYQQGIDVKVIIDGQVAALAGYNEAIQKLEAAHVPVIRWSRDHFAFEGQHRKMMIIDGEHIIAGGLNFGDVYSHKNPDLTVPRWRDTDVYLRGQVVEKGEVLFANIWNEQVQSRQLKLAQVDLTSIAKSDANPGSVAVTIMTHDPAVDKQGSTVLMTLLKGIREAQKSIDIENAYVVLTPAIKKEIQAALNRGVHVRVLTNSGTSVDEPVVSVPILRSVYELKKMGAEVYVKKGATLHSKLAVIDAQYTLIMSYNLHPRSERVEGEMAILVNNQDFAQHVTQVFADDISLDKAQHIEKLEDIDISKSAAVLPVLRIFFDML